MHGSFEIAHTLNPASTIGNQSYCQIRRIIDCRRRDIHKIFQPKMLLRIVKIELDLEVQPVIIYQLCRC
ncbi:MAG: hypothetical protein DWI30_02160 [Chloroflexi bacterium]|nr:MAG: hypothetical protein DWI30_02160 [Chloroflexota bacterium]